MSIKFTVSGLSAIAIVALSGCTAFTPPRDLPLVERTPGGSGSQIHAVATIADRRLTLVNSKDTRFCSEPPPDVATNISRDLNVKVSLDAPATLSPTAAEKIEVKLGTELASALRTQAQQLFYRTQGIQLYRDGAFTLCTAFLNATINEKEYLQRHDELLAKVVPLIQAELPLIEKIIAAGKSAVPK